ncbi:MAG: class I SAM-dependent methyltransferase [Actinomycetota bacterium]
MRGRDLKRILSSPRLLAHSIRAWAYELRHPNHPWWAPSAIRFLDSELDRDARVFEWGSGRSTLWLSERVGSLTSIEHIPDWFRKVEGMLAEAGADNVELRLAELPTDEAAFGDAFWEPNPYTTAADQQPDESLDLVIVDGACRMPCAWRALPKIAPGGLLLIDDTLHIGSVEAWKIPSEWELVHGTGPGVWSTTIWRKPPLELAD